MSSELDIGPLSWVKSEIDLALERAAAALDEHEQRPDTHVLSAAVKQLHQAHGALTIVGLDGITEFAAALKQLFEQLAQGQTAATPEAIDAARAGTLSLRAYLNDLMAGASNQTVRLHSTYAALLRAAGQPAPDATALFYPDLSQRPPKRESEPAPLPADQFAARIKIARMGFDRGLLKWLKPTGDDAARGAAEMKNSIAMIESALSAPAERAYWWAACAFLDALARNAWGDTLTIEPLRKAAMRIGAAVKHLSEGRREPPERALAELLYYIALCPAGLTSTDDVRAVYRLDSLIPHARLNDAERLKPKLHQLRELIASAKDAWNRLCSGAAAALPPFHQHITQLGEQIGALEHADLSHLASSLVTLTDALRRDPSRHTDVMGLEVATALLLTDSALENFTGLDTDFARHARTMADRLDALLAGRDLATLDIPDLDAMARRAQERLLMSTVAQEIQANLVTIEQTLDAYFRDNTKRDTLPSLSAPIKQVEGALMILGQMRAVAVMGEAQALIAALVRDDTTAARSVFESLAAKLSGIGFFVEEIERGGAPDIDVILAPRQPRRVISAGVTGAAVVAYAAAETPATSPTFDIPVLAPAMPASALPAPALLASTLAEAPLADSLALAPLSLTTDTIDIASAPPLAPPADVVDAPPAITSAADSRPLAADEPELDAELLDIFLEEAREVLDTIAAQLPIVQATPSDAEALGTLRRSYHTLKGSGRMVNLNELGEAAWGIEQLLNQWLQHNLAASPALLSLLSGATGLFSAWVAQLTEGGSAHYDASTLNAQTAALLAGDTGDEINAPVTDESASEEAALEFPETSTEAPDTRSVTDLLADMEAHDIAASARKAEDELAAAELAVAQISALGALAQRSALTDASADPAISPTIAVSPALTYGESVPDASPSDDSDSAIDAEVDTDVEPFLASTPLPSVSDEELLAAELATAETLSAAAQQQSETRDDLSVSASNEGITDAPASALSTEFAHEYEHEHASDTVETSDALTATEAANAALETASDADSADTAPSELASPEHTSPAGADIVPFPPAEPVRIGHLEISPALFAIYIEEAQQHMIAILAEIGNGVVPSDNLIRAAHTLGSTSGTTGIEAIQHLARALEESLGGLAIVDIPPTDEQQLLLARCAGALDGMLGAVLARRLPAEETALTADLRALKPSHPSPRLDLDPTPAPAPAPAPADIAALDARTMQLASPATSRVDLQDSIASDASISTPSISSEPTVDPADETQDIDLADEHRHSARLLDDIDEQLLPIFLEEAVDLLASIDAQLRGWRGQPDNDAFAKQLQRDLHTIKGSARMAGAMGCGDLYHSMESRIEQAIALRAINADLFDSLETSYDRGALLIERLQRGEYTLPEAAATEPTASTASPISGLTAESFEPPVAASATPSTTPAAAAPASPTPAPAAAAAPASHAPKSQIQLRVRADLVDNLVNEAGEMAISRARIEGEMRALKASLLELTDNVIRLRGQVREIEIQAETQMASQITELKAQAEIEGRAFDPLEFDRFTRFQELTRMMAESVNDVSTVQHSLLNNVTSADAALSAQARINRELSQRLMGVRMMPFESMAERLHRVIRQAAKDVGKRANLDIKGGQMGIDRSVLEHIGGPLEHLLRNCIAHGIEDPAGRAAAGKDAFGQVTLSLAQEGNDVVISLSDDGAGLNLAKIRQRGIERGLLSEGSPISEDVLISMIFQSGVSTADSVSAIAGRGVGMDVVKTEIEALGGRIEVSTTAGAGSVFRLYLPLTLAVSQAVIVLVGYRSYALPASMVEQASELKPEVIAKIRAEGHTEWMGRRYAYRYLPNLLGMSEAKPVAARRHWLLLIKGGTERLAIEIDGMTGNREIVIKNLGQQLRRIPGLAGATVLGNGEIGLILNPIALQAKLLQTEATLAAALIANETARLDREASGGVDGEFDEIASAENERRSDDSAKHALDAAHAPSTPTAVRRQPSDATVMVVDDSLTVRKVTGRLLGRQGYQVVTARDGVDALEQLTDMRPDVMLVDIEMPRMDGFELTRNIRADAGLREIPIIMITSRSADKHRNYAKEVGVNHYLGKPYDEALLLGLIDSFVNPTPQDKTD
jgi:chemosensory pili system protein ChpA (sensor histidine kinase/response regulator)